MRSIEVFHNPKAEELFAPSQGPTPPGGRAKVTPGQLNTLTGFVESDTMSDAVFKQQFVQFTTRGYAVDPSTSNYGYGGFVAGPNAQPYVGTFRFTYFSVISA